MCQSTTTPEAGNPRLQVPGAWYDVSSRISAARAVARCIFDAMPCGDRAVPILDEINHIGNLAQAIVDLLDLAARDNDSVESDLMKGVSSCN